MRAPTSRRFSIAANTSKLEVDNRFPLKKYYRTADNLLKQAHIYREERNLIELYVLLLRFSSLVGETIPEHQDFKAYPSKDRAAYTQKFTNVLLELEKIKPEVQKQVERLNNEIADSLALETNRENGYEWPPVSRTPAIHNFSIQKNDVVFHNRQNNFYESGQQVNTYSFKFPLPNKETLSRHSFLGPDGLRARWKPPVTQARVEYPSYTDASSTDVASLEDKWSKSLLSLEAPSVASVTEVEAAEPTSEKPVVVGSLDIASQPQLIKQPSPPPVSAPVQDLPVMAELMQLCKPQDSLSLSNVVDPSLEPLPILAKELKQSEKPKQLHISFKMMDEFMKLAALNTQNSIETCGVLAGFLKNAMFYVTALIIPKQQATSNTCQTVNEEEIFDWQDKRGLFQLGWIHTHPTQSCFMSSVDLHTHYSYQVMLPEAIAIVMAPTDVTRKYGIFRLSDPGGVKTIQKCQLRGFHAHEPPFDGSPIYEHSAHVLMSSNLKYQVVDLR